MIKISSRLYLLLLLVIPEALVLVEPVSPAFSLVQLVLLVVGGGGGGEWGRLTLHSRQLRDRSPTHSGGDIVSSDADPVIPDPDYPGSEFSRI